ncbi:MAG: TonB-dependent receptor plug domain-containing protein [Pseudomonadota bacterium]
MTTDRNKLDIEPRRLSLLLAAGVSSLSLAAAAPAMAQDDAVDEEENAITVVGSRIQRRGFEDIDQPALVLNAETLDKRGFTNLADALNELPGFGTGVGGLTTGSGQNPGQEFLDLFNLGTQRTLVLVNGRRFVPGNPLSADPIGREEGSQVDINNFPSVLIERVETLSIGGAPIYGADAIAGTVNIVLKRDFEGIDLSFQYDDFQEFSAPEYTVGGVFGANFSDGRGNVTASIQYENQQGAVANDVPGLNNQISAFGTGDVSILGNEGRFNILEGAFGFLPAPGNGVPLPFFGANVFTDSDGNILTFAGDGGLSVFDPGTRRGTSAVFGEGGSGFDLNDFQEAVVPVERFVFTSSARYDVTDNVRVFMETNFLNASGTDLVSQSGNAFNTAFLNTQGQGSFGVSIDNPFISEQDRQTLIGAGAGDVFFLNGINLGLLPDAGANFIDTTTYRVVGGLEGDFEAGERRFNWDVSMNFGRTSQARSVSVIRGDAFFNAVNSVRLDQAGLDQLNDADNQTALQQTINSSLFNVIRNGQVESINTAEAQVGDVLCSVFLDAPGPVDQGEGGIGISTGNTPTPNGAVAGCTPLNLFVGQIPGGNSPAAINFISSPAQGFGEISQTDFVANFGGDALKLPAGWLQFNIGVERRREFGSLQNGGVLEDGLSREPAVASFPQAEVVSNEAFGEVVIPVLSEDFNLGLSFINNLSFNGAYRYIRARGSSDSDQELLGSALSGSVNTYTAGGEMGLFENQLVLRGNYTRSVRQPSIVELFSPFAQAFDQTGDPCDVTNINDAPNTNRQANCVLAAQQLGFTGAAIGTIDGQTGLILAPGDNIFTTPSVNAAIPLQAGGNPNLNFEIGNSYTAGFVAQPDFIPGLTVRADYIRILVSDQITQPDFTFFTQTCFDTSLDAPECSNFTRVGEQPPTDGSLVGGFDITGGTTGFGNTGTLQLNAIQGQVRYGFNVADALKFSRLNSGERDFGDIAVNATFYAPLIIRESDRAQVDSQGRPVNLVGSTVNSAEELQLVADFNWRYRGFDFFWRATYDDNINPCFFRTEGDCDDIPEFALVLQRDVEHDMSIGYQFTDYAGIRVGVNNVFDNDLTIEQQAFGGGGNSFGRNFFFRLNLRN